MTRNANFRTNHFSALDTTFVLFFLSLELGRSATFFGIDTLLMSITLLMVLVLPYFLIEDDGVPAFGRWVAERLSIGFMGLVLGFGFRESIGTLLPEAFGYVPMTLLIISAMICSYVQIYGLMRLRLAK